MGWSRVTRRWLFVLGVLVLFGLLNTFPFGGWLPVGVGPDAAHRFGHGFPLKWWYDPAYRHTGKKRDQHSLSPRDAWAFDGSALAVDVATGLAVALTALAIRILQQRSRGG